MKSFGLRLLLAGLCLAPVAGVWAWEGLPPPPPLPPPPMPAGPGAARDPHGNWRTLSPEQRDAIRRLSQEQREALIKGRPGVAGAGPAPRLSPEERRQLRAQIREEHERRRFGGAKRF